MMSMIDEKRFHFRAMPAKDESSLPPLGDFVATQPQIPQSQ